VRRSVQRFPSSSGRIVGNPEEGQAPGRELAKNRHYTNCAMSIFGSLGFSGDDCSARLYTQQRGKPIAVPTGCIWKGVGSDLRRVGADKPMGVYTGVALNAA
jgi:hypothetical protein